MTPVIPPPVHAIVHGNDQTGWHDQIVKYIDEKGFYAFHKKYGRVIVVDPLPSSEMP